MPSAQHLYRSLLWFFPAAFRQEYGDEMTLAFADQLGEARRSRRPLETATVWLRALSDIAIVAPKEHWHVILQDIRYTFRTLAASPGFAAVAILSLALGIGANTAIFSVWNAVLRAVLPVRDPSALVILSNPASMGVWIGSQTGERPLFTYQEFEQLRDHTSGFSGLMASQSSMEQLQVRPEGQQSQHDATGRMVSSAYFDVLGISPFMGRVFTQADDSQPAPYAVISHRYWQRAFGGRSDVLGKSVAVRKATLTVIGVAPPWFHGETSGQSPDLWIPISMQSSILPGRDWLHDVPPEKVMWLHVFGRLEPGTSLAQAQASANAVFQAGLQTYYGGIASPEARKEFLNQSLHLRPAASGASPFRDNFGDPLNVLLAAVGIVLLIACANIANLMLARGTARQREIALRLSLGASRTRLIRQLLTESLVIALAGGALAIVFAVGFRTTLVNMMAATVTTLELQTTIEPRVLAFNFAVTLGAAVLVGLLPALLGTRANAAETIKEQGRNATSTSGQLRWGRLLVILQLALSLPLLIGAGLLLQTLNNLHNVDLGYRRENLLAVRADAESAGYPAHRREPLFRDLLERIRRVPGVNAATFSENGLFGGNDSGDQIEVEGFTPKTDADRGSRWDQVGPNYFTSLGVPLILGRDILPSDQGAAPKVCVINESFAKRFFEGRNPIGMRITTAYGERRITHTIVGVSKNIRTHRLRGDTPHRNFVPMAQPLGEMGQAYFLVRASGDPATVLNAIQQAIREVDPSLPLTGAGLINERIDQRMVQERMMARLAVAFGCVALALSAIGLYGVLSYGVARRKTEIGIRVALGAEPGRVARMILRETSATLVAGLIFGGALAYAVTRFLSSQLYGLTPNDPVTLVVAIAILMAVALAAAWLPAIRASKLDPMSVLRQE